AQQPRIFLGINILNGRERAEHRRIEHEHIELSPAFRNSSREFADIVAIGKVERSDRRTSAARVDLLLDLLKVGGLAGNENDVGPGVRERLCRRGTDSTARAGYERQAVRQWFRIIH